MKLYDQTSPDVKLTLALPLLRLPFHTRKGLRDPFEQRLDIMSYFGAGFNEHQVVLLGLLFSLLSCDLSLVVQISLVTHQYNDNIIAPLTSDIVDPLARVLKGFEVWEFLLGAAEPSSVKGD